MGRRLSATRSPGDQQSQAPGDVFFNGVFGQPHPPGDLLLRKIVDAPQHQGALGLRRQDGDRLSQTPQSVPIRDDTLGRRRILEQVALLELFQRLERHDPRPPHMGRHERTRRLKQIGLWMTDVVHPIARRQKAVGLLDHILRLQPIHAPARQPGAQRRFMRQDLTQQPARPPFIKVVRHVQALPPKRSY
ncbi:hypothetical protein D3C85_565270 [compost metagenome]